MIALECMSGKLLPPKFCTNPHLLGSRSSSGLSGPTWRLVFPNMEAARKGVLRKPQVIRPPHRWHGDDDEASYIYIYMSLHGLPKGCGFVFKNVLLSWCYFQMT